MIEYIQNNLWLFWLIIAIVSLILELSSGTFFIMCFAIGSIITIFCTLLGIPFWSQVLLFAIFSTLSIYWVRPLAIKYLHSSKKERLSNADALISREGIVSETIEQNGYGRVKVDGDDWKAKSIDGNEIAKGTTVEIVNIESIIITVKEKLPINNIVEHN
jgi:membrane protein implicated in regulation of membrane protease activity